MGIDLYYSSSTSVHQQLLTVLSYRQWPLELVVCNGAWETPSDRPVKDIAHMHKNKITYSTNNVENQR